MGAIGASSAKPESRHHPVAGRKLRHILPNADNGACAFMAEHGFALPPLRYADIGVADANSAQLNDHLIGHGIIKDSGRKGGRAAPFAHPGDDLCRHGLCACVAILQGDDIIHAQQFADRAEIIGGRSIAGRPALL